LLQEQRRQLQAQRLELEAARAELRTERLRAQERQSAHERWHLDAQASLDRLGADFEEALASETAQASAAASARNLGEEGEREAVARLRAGASEAQASHEESRTWTEAQQQKYLELSTEVLTLRTMAATELRERQVASRAQVSELTTLKKTMGELKVAAKSLRDNVRLRTAGDEPGGSTQKPEDISSSLADFSTLPLSTRFSVLAEDADVLRLAGLSVLLGMLVMLGVFVEGFSLWRCRFACVR